MSPFLAAMAENLTSRCFFTTKNDLIGVGPGDTLVGNCVCILFGGDRCFILDDSKAEQLLKGDAYVHGVMSGEMMDIYDRDIEGSPQEREFSLLL
jgi:hypothetical protein